MKPDELKVQEILADGTRFLVPPYQRAYQWGSDLWFELWQDIAQLHQTDPSSPSHFLGFIILQNRDVAVGQPALHAIVDGQQRITTLALLDLAITDAIADLQSSSANSGPRNRLQFSKDGTTYNTLQLSPLDRDQFAKLISSPDSWRQWYQKQTSVNQLRSEKTTDRLFLCYVFYRRILALGSNCLDIQEADQISIPKYTASQIGGEGSDPQTAELIWGVPDVQEPMTPEKLMELRDTLHKRNQLLALYIDANDEPPVAIYDSVNAKKRALMQWDFARSEIFLTFNDVSRAERIVLGEWAKFENLVNLTTDDGAQSGPLDILLYDYLIARGEKQIQGSISRNRTSTMFQSRFRRVIKVSSNGATLDDAAENFISEDLLKFSKSWIISAAGMAGHWNKAAFNEATDFVVPTFTEKEKFHFQAIGNLSFAPLHPLLARLVEYYVIEGKGERSDFLKCLLIVESYVVRLILSNRPLSPLRSRITSLFKVEQLESGVFRDVVIEPKYLFSHLSEMGSDNRPIVPSDKDLRSALDEGDYYEKFDKRWLGVVFRGIERSMAGPLGAALPYGGPQGLSVEHVFPQNSDKEWQEELEDWLLSDGKSIEVEAELQELSSRCNSIGNLTLIQSVTNSAIGNREFSFKKEVLAGNNNEYQHPFFSISNSIISKNRWYASDIDNRRDELATHILNIWPWNWFPEINS